MIVYVCCVCIFLSLCTHLECDGNEYLQLVGVNKDDGSFMYKCVADCSYPNTPRVGGHICDGEISLHACLTAPEYC